MMLVRSYGLRAAVVVLIGFYGAFFALLATPAARIALVVPVAAVALLWWMLAGTQRWVAVLLASATLLPPLPVPLGDSGPHAAMLVALAGVLIGVARMNEWRPMFDSVTTWLCCFFAVLAASAGPAFILSGGEVAAPTLARVALFGIGVYVFLYAAHGPGSSAMPLAGPVRWMFAMAVLAAVLACLDFYYQFPAPAGFSPQFVWLDTGIFRRAQGFYYDASALGNFCAFFLVLTAVGLMDHSAFRPLPRWVWLGGGSILAAALVLSYSRASLLNVVAAGVTLAVVKRVRVKRIATTLAAAAVVTFGVVWYAFPSFAESYWIRLSASLEYFWSSPEGVLSGRVASWQTLVDFLMTHPWFAIFGIGYKTLPYSTIASRAVIPDNMYLSLLVETGVLGVAALLLFSGAVIRLGYRAAHDASPETRFVGTWMVCFWVGQMVQMMSGDLLTYWRVLPVYLWVFGIVVRRMKGRPADADLVPRSV